MTTGSIVNEKCAKGNLPKELIERPQWTLWRFESSPKKPDGNPDKVPYQPDGKKARPNDPSTWARYCDVAAKLTGPPNGWAGLGFVLSKDDPYVGVDLDDCRDPRSGALDSLVAHLVREHPSYLEVSPSGRGIKGWYRGAMDDFGPRRPSWAKSKYGVELYDSGRFFTMTGERVEGATNTIAPLPDDAREWLSKIAAANALAGEMGDGNRHVPIGAVAGWLLRLGWPDDDVRLFCEHVATKNGGDPQNQMKFVESTIDLYRAGEPVTGLPTLAETVDDRVLRNVRRWLGDTTGKVISLEFTDLGNAHLFAELHGDVVRVATDEGVVYVFDGVVWSDSTNGAHVRSLAHDTVQELAARAAKLTGQRGQDALRWAAMSHNSPRIDAMIRELVGLKQLQITRDSFDSDPYLLNTPGGIVDLRTGKLGEHDPNALCTKMTKVTPRFGMATPTFDAFVERIWPNEKLRTYVFRAIGSSLVARTEKVVYVCCGPGNTGKTTLISDIVGEALGDYAAEVDKQALSADARSNAEYYRVPLVGARMAIVGEPDRNFGIDAAYIKKATGGNVQHARRPRGNPIEFRPTATWWIDTNYEPKADHGDDALWNRLRLIPFSRPVPTKPGHEGYDPDFKKKIEAEMPGILAKMIEWCVEWQRAGDVGEVEEVLAATTRYRAEQDPLTDFVEECLELGAEYTAPVSAVRKAYENWSYSLPPKDRLGPRDFNRAMEARGFERKTVRDGARVSKAWVGFALTGPDGGEEKEMTVPTYT